MLITNCNPLNILNCTSAADIKCVCGVLSCLKNWSFIHPFQCQYVSFLSVHTSLVLLLHFLNLKIQFFHHLLLNRRDWTLRRRGYGRSPKRQRKWCGLDVAAVKMQAEVQIERENVSDWTSKLRGSRQRSKLNE